MSAKFLGLLAVLAAPLAAAADAQSTAGVEGNAQRAVLVTGASTGIGRAITEHLAAAGFHVYAGARKDKDLAELDAIANVDAIRLDVTNAADIAAAVDTITKAGRGLYGLVNNAGVAVRGALAETKPEDFDFVMQVNVYGVYNVTRAFAPLIVASKGRIVTIGSISGTLSAPNFGVYSMSKHAVEAFTDSLAAEMAPLGVQVSVIEPGNYNSEIGASAVKRTGADPKFADRSMYKEPDEVAIVALRALTEPTPQRRYMIVPNQREAEFTIKKALAEVVQLNEGQVYTYSRDQLVAMLDAALAGSRPALPAPPTAAVTEAAKSEARGATSLPPAN
jgi:NAD(P)-dependent dehydrogenase (short-subunit alcohol dehydrogenase family)